MTPACVTSGQHLPQLRIETSEMWFLAAESLPPLGGLRPQDFVHGEKAMQACQLPPHSDAVKAMLDDSTTSPDKWASGPKAEGLSHVMRRRSVIVLL